MSHIIYVSSVFGLYIRPINYMVDYIYSPLYLKYWALNVAPILPLHFVIWAIYADQFLLWASVTEKTCKSVSWAIYMFHFIQVFPIFWALYTVHFSWPFLSFLIMGFIYKPYCSCFFGLYMRPTTTLPWSDGSTAQK